MCTNLSFILDCYDTELEDECYNHEYKTWIDVITSDRFEDIAEWEGDYRRNAWGEKILSFYDEKNDRIKLY